MYESDVPSCYEGYEESSQIENCLSEAERAFHTGLYAAFGALYDEGHSWSYGWYYRTMGWALLIEIVGPPASLYGLVWPTASTLAWVWRGSKARSPTRL